MREARSLLILGGTREAADLARRLSGEPGLRIVTSLAGRTRTPAAIAGDVRSGGFGGADGLAGYLRTEAIDLVVDATHPFATEITANAAEACGRLAVPRLRLLRPPWSPMPKDRWIEVGSLAEAADRMAAIGERIFLSVGRQNLTAFAEVTGCWFLVRMVDAPEAPLPLAHYAVVTGRGPFRLPDEAALLRRNGIDALVSRNSGGSATYAKIAAARSLQLPVLMVRRPPEPPGERVATAATALAWIREYASER